MAEHIDTRLESLLRATLKAEAASLPLSVGPEDVMLRRRGRRSGSVVSRRLWPATSLRLAAALAIVGAVAVVGFLLSSGRLPGLTGASPSPSAGPSPTPESVLEERFVDSGALLTPRARHAATLLHDGRVLIVGGTGAEGPLASAEIWDPATETFVAAGPMAVAREQPTATLLNDGRVLIVGGAFGDPDRYHSAEVFDPATGQFNLAGELAEPRIYHTATLLPDGRVLVVGGLNHRGDVALAETWDPETGLFSPAGVLHEARHWHAASVLTDGRVLVTGGVRGDRPPGSAELWDPGTASFALVLSPQGLAAHTSTLLGDGRVLVAGGDISPGADAWLWDPVTERFTPTAALPEERTLHTATLLPDGRVLMIGGQTIDHAAGQMLAVRTAQAWQPGEQAFTVAGTLREERFLHSATLLTDGRVLVVGGEHFGSEGDAEPVASAELWIRGGQAVAPPRAQSSLGSFAHVGSLSEPRPDHTATLLDVGRVLIVGGQGTALAEVWDQDSSSFQPAGSLTVPRYTHTATLLADGRVLIVGGVDENGERLSLRRDLGPGQRNLRAG